MSLPSLTQIRLFHIFRLLLFYLVGFILIEGGDLFCCPNGTTTRDLVASLNFVKERIRKNFHRIKLERCTQQKEHLTEFKFYSSIIKLIIVLKLPETGFQLYHIHKHHHYKFDFC